MTSDGNSERIPDDARVSQGVREVEEEAMEVDLISRGFAEKILELRDLVAGDREKEEEIEKVASDIEIDARDLAFDFAGDVVAAVVKAFGGEIVEDADERCYDDEAVAIARIRVGGKDYCVWHYEHWTNVAGRYIADTSKIIIREVW